MSSKLKSLIVRKSTWLILTLLILLFFVLIPYAKIFVLSYLYAEEFLNTPCNAYFNAKEVKVYDYAKEEHAKCLILADNGMYCTMVDYEWDSSQNEWKYVIDSCVWTRYGGNAHKFYWPIFYLKEFLFG